MQRYGAFSETSSYFPSQTEAECYPDYCIAGLVPSSPSTKCQSYCTFPIPQAACTFQTIPPIGTSYDTHGDIHILGYRSWFSWKGPVTGTQYSACVYVGIPRSNCMAGGGTWRQGMQWFPEAYNKPELCTGVCYSGISLFPSTKGTYLILCSNRPKKHAKRSLPVHHVFLEPKHLAFLRRLARNLLPATMIAVSDVKFANIDPIRLSFLSRLPQNSPVQYPLYFHAKSLSCELLQGTPDWVDLLTRFKPNCDQSTLLRGPENIRWQYRFTNQTQCLTDSFICRLKGTPLNKTYVGAPSLPEVHSFLS